MSMVNEDNTPEVRISGDRQGGTTVPGSPGSGPCAESREGPQSGGVLPVGTQPGHATADDVYRSSSEREDPLIRFIVNRYLGKSDTGAAASGSALIGGNLNDDAISVSSISGFVNLKRTRVDQDSTSDSDTGSGPRRVHKVLRSRVIGSDSNGPNVVDPPIILSDSSENVATKVRGKKSRVRNRDANMDLPMNLDLSADLANLVFTNCSSRLACEDVADKDVDDLAGTAMGWLNDMELIRTKSRKLNGRLSGCLKDRIACMQSMIRILVDRVKDST